MVTTWNVKTRSLQHLSPIRWFEIFLEIDLNTYERQLFWSKITVNPSCTKLQGFQSTQYPFHPTTFIILTKDNWLILVSQHHKAESWYQTSLVATRIKWRSTLTLVNSFAYSGFSHAHQVFQDYQPLCIRHQLLKEVWHSSEPALMTTANISSRLPMFSILSFIKIKVCYWPSLKRYYLIRSEGRKMSSVALAWCPQRRVDFFPGHEEPPVAFFNASNYTNEPSRL